MLKFAPIMPAFCFLLLYSYYANNFAGKIEASLVVKCNTHGECYGMHPLAITDINI